MNAVHDMGGLPSEQPIDRSEHHLMEWERRTGALVDVLREKRVINTDELRRGIEAIPPDEYRRLGYYERWSTSLEILLVEKGLLTKQEIDGRAATVGARWA